MTSNSAPLDTRARLLEAAIIELAVNGSKHFRAKEICASEFVARSLLNHHFGSQADLVAEATFTAYSRYVVALRDAAQVASTPRERLESWMLAQAHWMQQHPGIAALLHFPHASFAARLKTLFGSQMRQLFQFNMAVLGTLVLGVQQGKLLSLDFDVESSPYANLAAELPLLMQTSSVGLSALGASVWAAGTEAPSHQVSEYFLNEAVLTQHARWVSGTLS